MNKKLPVALLATIALSLLFSSSATLVQAAEVQQSGAVNPIVIESILEETDEFYTTEYTEKGQQITEFISEDSEVVKAIQITDIDRNETSIISNDGEKITVIQTIFNEERNEFEDVIQEFPLIERFEPEYLNLTTTAVLLGRSIYGRWTYTGLAIGRDLFAWFFNITAGAAVGKIAVIFGVSSVIAQRIFNFAGIKLDFGGIQVARFLDADGNGWIALYKRTVQNVTNGPIVAYSHRTY